MDKKYEADITPLFTLIKKQIFKEDDCYCGSSFGICVCDPVEDPRYYVYRVDVDLVGCPVVTKPADSTYRVQIYDTTRKQSEMDDSWEEVSVYIEFSITPKL